MHVPLVIAVVVKEINFWCKKVRSKPSDEKLIYATMYKKHLKHEV